MSLISTITLVIILTMPDSSTNHMFAEHPTLEACIDHMRKVLARAPDEFGAIAIGAGCIVHPHGRPS